MAKKVKTDVQKPKPNANYDYKQHAPKVPMGSGSFANMPTKPMRMELSGRWDMRDAIRNSPICTLNEITEVDENTSEAYDND